MTRLTKTIHPTVKNLKKIDIWLEKKLKSYDDELRSSILMAGIELLENALKYHMDNHLSQKIIFQIIISETVEIIVTNRLKGTDDAKVIIDHISKINHGADPREQYMYRLKEIMENRVYGESQLGLLRIAGEGNFSIQYNLTENSLTVIARKYYNYERNSAMDSLITKDFSIIIKKNDPLEVIWTGKSRDLNPSLLIDKYLDNLITQLLDKDILVDFSTMEALNSSTIPPILTFLSNLEKRRIRAKIQYSKDIYWQRASFKPLAVLTRDFVFVKIQAI